MSYCWLVLIALLLAVFIYRNRNQSIYMRGGGGSDACASDPKSAESLPNVTVPSDSVPTPNLSDSEQEPNLSDSAQAQNRCPPLASDEWALSIEPDGYTCAVAGDQTHVFLNL
jgi:hypothetical protein